MEEDVLDRLQGGRVSLGFSNSSPIFNTFSSWISLRISYEILGEKWEYLYRR